MNFGIQGGYNVPPLIWENQRKIEFERAFVFAQKERRQNEGGN